MEYVYAAPSCVSWEANKKRAVHDAIASSPTRFKMSVDKFAEPCTQETTLRVASLARDSTMTYNQDTVAAGLHPVSVGGVLNNVPTFVA